LTNPKIINLLLDIGDVMLSNGFQLAATNSTRISLDFGYIGNELNEEKNRSN
jgi:hypothetical protein